MPIQPLEKLRDQIHGRTREFTSYLSNSFPEDKPLEDILREARKDGILTPMLAARRAAIPWNNSLDDDDSRAVINKALNKSRWSFRPKPYVEWMGPYVIIKLKQGVQYKDLPELTEMLVVPGTQEHPDKLRVAYFENGSWHILDTPPPGDLSLFQFSPGTVRSDDDEFSRLETLGDLVDKLNPA